MERHQQHQHRYRFHDYSAFSGQRPVSHVPGSPASFAGTLHPLRLRFIICRWNRQNTTRNQYARRTTMSHATKLTLLRHAGTVALALCLALMAACGSTKVYTADKTVIYRDSIYNISNVQRITSKKIAVTPGGQEVNLANMDTKALKTFFKDNPGSTVSMYMEMDDQQLTYVRTKVDSYNDYSRLSSRYDKALKDLTKFMGDKKKTQLKLK
jgi:hypothetical protein